MGKLTRGTLWALFPPAGYVASRRAGRRRDGQQLEEAIARGVAQTSSAVAEPDDARRRLVETLTRTANDPTASAAARKLAEKKLADLGQ